jgi:predicted PurR-regulated permease PerM
VGDQEAEGPTTAGGTPDGASPRSSTMIPDWVGNAIWRGIWQAIAAVLLTLLALWAAHQTSDLLRYLFLSLLLSFCIEPAVIYLHEHRGWRRGSATGLILAAAFLLILVMTLVIGAALVKGANGIVTSLPQWIADVNKFWQDHFHKTLISSSSAATSTEAAGNVNGYLQEHAGDLIGSVAGVLGGIFSIFTVGMFTFYMTANGHKMRRAVLSRMPPEKQRRVLWTLEESIKKMGGYLYSGACWRRSTAA